MSNAVQRAFTRVSEISLLEGNILLIQMKDGMDITAADIEEGMRVQQELTRGELFSTLVDFRNVSLGHVDREVFSRQAANKHAPNKKAEAYVINSLAIKMIVNFYMRFFKPKVPVKIFNDVQEAEKWLRKIK